MQLEEEIKEIYSQFNKVITYSQNIENPKTQSLFKTWYENKSKFINMFGNKLIYEYPEKVSFELNEKEQKQRVIKFIDEVANNWCCHQLSYFLEIQQSGFFKNITIEDFKIPGGKTIKKGTKLIKSFKYFLPESRELEDIQNEASRIIQENKVEGTLCLSIHPLDFLSSSENTYNWHSCHSLDGDYRAGNISYMLDKCTAICYLKGDTNEKLPNFPEEVPWNSKKWRMLIDLSEDDTLILAGRQYPFESNFARDFVLENIIKYLMPKHHYFMTRWSGWNECATYNFKIDDQNFSCSGISLSSGIINLNNIVLDTPCAQNYNDILYSSCYKPVYSVLYNPAINTTLATIDRTKMHIGHEVPCLRCGKAMVMEPGSGTMMCESCTLEYGEDNSDLFAYCSCCGRRFFDDEGYYVGDNDFVCPDCYDNYAIECDCCGFAFYKDDMHYDEKTERYLCPDCYEQMEEE